MFVIVKVPGPARISVRLLMIGKDGRAGGRESRPQVDVADRLRGGGVMADAGPNAETPHLGDGVRLRLRVYCIPVLWKQMPAIRRAADCLVARHAPGARDDRRRADLSR